jgi:anaerobic magnesium-protoporphyrin IX monomethyl ester cyclase
MGMDSQKAAQLVDHIFLSIRQPLWVPQYNFEFDGIFHLLHREMTLEAAKGFISSFNNAIKTKLQHPANREIDFRLVEEIKKYCQGNPFNDNTTTGNPNAGSQYGEGFDF